MINKRPTSSARAQHFIIVYGLTLALSIWLIQPSRAEGFSYGEYSQNVNSIAQTILSKCKAGGIGSTLDNRQFQKSCGVAMRGQLFSGFKASVFFSSEKLENGWRDVLGVETRHEVDEEQYSLVRGILTEGYRPHEQDEKAASYADATLFVKREQGWQLVWKFVNPHANDWHRSNPLFPEQQGLTPKVSSMIDRLWRETVVQGTSKLAFNIKDTSGPVFTARNPKVR